MPFPWILPLLAQFGAQLYAGMGAAEEARQAQAIYKRRALLAEREAEDIKEETKRKRIYHAEEAERAMASLEAKLGASGAVTTIGAGELIRARQAAELELENLDIGYRGMAEAEAARSQAQIERMYAKMYGKKAKREMIGGFLEAGGTLLAGFGEFGGFGQSSAGQSLLPSRPGWQYGSAARGFY